MSSGSSSSKQKVQSAVRSSKAEYLSQPVVPIGSSFQAEVPEWSEPANLRIYRNGDSGNSKMIVEDASMVDSDYLLLRSGSSSSKRKVRPAVRFLKAEYPAGPVIPIGPVFQAEAPEWMGQMNQGINIDGNSENLKWLDTRVWPMEGKSTPTICLPIGKGRSNSCSCIFRGSAKCIKRHVREENLLMQSNLGPAFFSWKFNNMGEVVSESWTAKEEKTFGSLMKQNPFSREISFWELALKHFPSKRLL